MIDSIVSSLTIGNVSPSSIQFSRVGVVAVSDKAEVITMNIISDFDPPGELDPRRA